MNRSDAKMIAEELHKFIRNDVRKAVLKWRLLKPKSI